MIPLLVTAASEVAAAQKVVGKHYHCAAEPSDCADRKILFWSHEPRYLAGALEVAYIDSTLTPTEADAQGWRWKQFLEFGAPLKRILTESSQPAGRAPESASDPLPLPPPAGLDPTESEAAQGAWVGDASHAQGDSASPVVTAPALATFDEIALEGDDQPPEYPDYYYAGNTPESAIPAPTEAPNGHDLLAEAEAMAHGGHWERAEQSADWSDPVDILGGDIESPDLDASSCPEALQAHISDAAERGGFPVGAVLFGDLAACCGAMDGNFMVQPKLRDTEWTERPNGWFFVYGPSGYAKTPSIEVGLKAILAYDTDLRVNNVEHKRKHDLDMEVHERHRKAYVDKTFKGEPATMPDPVPPPKDERIMLESSTLEGIRSMLAANTRGILIYAEELAGLIGSFDRYAKGGAGADRAYYLGLHKGGRFVVEREGRSIVVPNWLASIAAALTPSFLPAMQELQGDGFLQRAMVCLVGKRGKEIDRDPNYQALDDYKKLIRNLHRMNAIEGRDVIKLSSGAAEARDEFWGHIINIIDAKRVPELMISHLQKFKGLIPRMALIYHIIEAGQRDKCPDPEISTHTMERVIRMLQWEYAQIDIFWNRSMMQSDKSSLLNKMALAILVHTETTLKTRDLSRNISDWAKMTIPQKRGAVSALTDAGWIAPSEAGRSLSVDGLPREWRVNPMVRERFAIQAQDEKARRVAMRASLPWENAQA